MLKTLLLLLPLLTLSVSCAPVPVAVECPISPPVPQILLEPIENGPSSSQLIETYFQQFERRLTDAAKGP